MDVYLLVLLAIAVVGLAVTAGLSFVPAVQVWALERAGRRIGIGVPADLDPAFRRRMGRRIRASALGALAGLALGLLLASTVPGWGLPYSHRPILLAYYGVIAFGAVGSAVGVIVVSLASAPRPGDDAARVARLTVTSVGDYIAPILRRLALAASVCAVVTVGLAIALGGTSRVHLIVPGIVLVALAIAGQIAFAVAARRIVAQGRPTRDTDEMVWDDALRWLALRDILSGPLQALCFGAFYGVLGTLNGPGALALITAFASLVLVAVFNIATRNNTDWFLLRLWPGARRRTDDEEAARLAAADPATAPWPDPSASHR
ncbi:hypothetical protein [Frondihabitans australicus]|uniref:Uncharacterized protein n=1 Tax=Frondihabitans australicus TaxID=386892 RepID=A0A495IHA2_9MICO|nr:hypothetical protein [Frondihabitans australicus]RKR75383.1 hypothetical protein C8E83_2529 [Frondihabitans australicus]